MKNILILAAGKYDASFGTFSGYKSYGMYPIRGKPSILRIIDTVQTLELSNATIVVDVNNTSLINLLSSHHIAKRCKILPIDTSMSSNGVLDTLSLGLSECDVNIPTQIILGDTLIMDAKSDVFDVIFTSKKFQNSHRWCLLTKDESGKIVNYFDKIENIPTHDKEVLTGLYNLSDTKLLKSSLDIAISRQNKEISDVLTLYQQNRSLFAVNVEKWYDLSSPYAIAMAGSDFFNVRHFNSISISDIGILTKSSTNKTKLKQEENWYKLLPKNLQIFAPRVINSYEDDAKFYLSLEMYGYQTLSEVFVYSDKDLEDWHSILTRLIKAYNLFGQYNSNVINDYLISIYKTKTFERIDALKKNDYFADLLNYDNIVINGVKYTNYKTLEAEITNNIDKIINSCDKQFSIIHGDLCFSNILFDAMNYCFKFIDPRGDVVYGDPRYDIAKIRHSVAGLYDFIVLEMFELNQISETNFDLKIFIDEDKLEIGKYFDAIVEKQYDLFEIKFIEALLFLTMIPLHKDNRDRQIAFYLIAIKKFNELLMHSDIAV